MQDAHRILRTIRNRATLIASVLGLLLAAVGALVGLRSFWGVLPLGVGTSLIAAAAYTVLTRVQEEFAESLREQGLIDLFPSRLRQFTDDDWPRLIESAKDHYYVLGVANHGYMGSEPVRESIHHALAGAAHRKVSVEFLWLNPDSDFAGAREEEEKRTTRRDTVDAIEWFGNFRASLADDEQKQITLLEYDAIPSCGLTWSDDQLVVTHYVAGQNNLDSPGMILSTSSIGLIRPLRSFAHGHTRRAPTAQAYMNTYKEIRSHATEITLDRVKELVAKRPTYGGGPSERDLRERIQKTQEENQL